METTYKVIKPENSNSIIAELNAKVLTATFKSKEGIQKGDLYRSSSTSDTIVAHNTCAPINSEFIQTINLTF